MTDRKTKTNFFKEHKTELIIAGTTVLTIAGVVLLMKNWDDIVALIPAEVPSGIDHVVESPVEPIIQAAIEAPAEVLRFDSVPYHLRNLPAGQHASQQAIDNATARGIILEAGKTFVSDYIRPRAA